MAQPTVVYIIVENPASEITVGSAPATTLLTYEFPIEGTIDETVEANAKRFQLGSILRVTTDARVDTYDLAAQLTPRD